MKKMKHFYGVSLLTAVCLAACTPENAFEPSSGNMKSSIAFAVSTSDDQSTSTRCDAESYVVDTFVVGNDTLCLICTETDLCASAPAVEETSATRGTPIYTSPSAAVEGGKKIFNLNSEYGEFKASAYLDGDVTKPLCENYVDTDGNTVTGGAPFSDIAFKYNSNEGASGSETRYEYWYPDIADDKYYWWQEYKLTFYAYAPTTNSTTLKWTGPGSGAYQNGGKMTFSYAVPVSSATPKTDAEAQPDILVTSTGATPLSRPAPKTIKLNGVTTTDKYYEVPLTFFHALSGVRFCVGKPDAATEDNLTGYTIESITLSKLRPSGKCTFDPTGKNLSTVHSSDVISWSDYSSTDGTYTQTFSHKIVDGTTGGEMAYGTTTSQTFMLLPQTLGESGTNSPDSKVGIVLIDKAGVKHNLEVEHLKGSKSKGTSAWLPGKMYTYKIATKQKDVTVTIDDDVTTSPNKKSDLVISNTGSTAAYIRVAAVANWYKDGTTFTTPYNATDFATALATNVGTGKPWYLGTDGFYYYRNPLLGGYQITGTNNLFNEITFGGTAPEATGWHLEVNLVVQAVRTNDVEEAWGTGIITTAGLTTTPSSTDTKIVP